MSTYDVACFRLIDPPLQQVDIITKAIEEIDFPWELIAPELKNDPDKAVLVEWNNTGQNVSGVYLGAVQEIHLSGLDRNLGWNQAFVFAHEVGHLVDLAVLKDKDRASIISLMHKGPFIQIGHYNHDHPDAGHTSELWWDGGQSYTAQISECFADQFVAAFAPNIWNGSFGGSNRYPRFVHWTEDHAEIKRLTLLGKFPAEEVEDAPMFRDVKNNHPQQRFIERAVTLGYLKARRKRLFRPRAKLTRGEAAEMAVKLHNRMK